MQPRGNRRTRRSAGTPKTIEGFVSQKEQEGTKFTEPPIRAVGRGEVVTLGRKKKTDLFVNRVALSENKVAAEQPRKKGIVGPLFPAVQLPLEK